MRTGLVTYSYDTRANLKKLLPTCKQPSTEEVAKANKFQQIKAEKLAANTKKANDELECCCPAWRNRPCRD